MDPNSEHIEKLYREDPNYKRIEEERNMLIIIRDNMRGQFFIETKFGAYQTYQYTEDKNNYKEIIDMNNKIYSMYYELEAIKAKTIKST